MVCIMCIARRLDFLPVAEIISLEIRLRGWVSYIACCTVICVLYGNLCVVASTPARADCLVWRMLSVLSFSAFVAPPPASPLWESFVRGRRL